MATNSVVVPVKDVVVAHEVLMPLYVIQTELLTQLAVVHTPVVTAQDVPKVGAVQQDVQPCSRVVAAPHRPGL